MRTIKLQYIPMQYVASKLIVNVKVHDETNILDKVKISII